jgi:hypothetical protein
MEMSKRNIEYYKVVFPILIVAILFSIYLIFIMGLIFQINIFRDIVFIGLSRTFDAGTTFVLVEKFGGIERNPRASKTLKKWGYKYELLLGFLLSLFLIIILFLTLVDKDIRLYYLGVYSLFLFSIFLGLNNIYYIIKSLIKQSNPFSG